MANTFTVALAGNPNAGKTTLFNALTGAHQHVANWPGVTVEKKTGSVRYNGNEFHVVDLPGTYSLTAYSMEELIVRRFCMEEHPDVIVNILDASNLDRNLYLTLQFMELGMPMVVVLNMMDEAEKKGFRIDHVKLSEMLGIPVIPMVARSRKGVDELIRVLNGMTSGHLETRALEISYGADIDQALEELSQVLRKGNISADSVPRRWIALKFLEEDAEIQGMIPPGHPIDGEVRSIVTRLDRHMNATLAQEPATFISEQRYGYIAGIAKNVMSRTFERRREISDTIDVVLTNRLFGPLLLFGVLYLLYEFVFWASEIPVGWFESFFSWMGDIISTVVPQGLISSLLVSGIIHGVGGVFGFVPLIAFMFFAIAILEDSGYMARAAYMLDRVLRIFGLHGNSVMALFVSGGIAGGCAVPGVMATRTLRDPRERMATLLVAPFMNCGAKIPVFALLVGAFFTKDRGRVMFLITLAAWGFALVAARVLRSTVLRGPKTPFVMELPPYRVPTLKGLLIHTWERTYGYIRKAGTVILAVSIIIWAMLTFPQLPESKRGEFSAQRETMKAHYLTIPAAHSLFENEQALDRFDEYYVASRREKPTAEASGQWKRFAGLVPSGKSQKTEAHASETPELRQAAAEYAKLRGELNAVDSAERAEEVHYSLAGRIGSGLEVITRPLGFDWRTNIALVGGFAAKEVIVSTLGTAYSLGAVDPEESESLRDRLRSEPGWTTLTGITLILFVMLYSPCFVTLVCIARESSWKWMLFSMVSTTGTAYVVALVFHQTGRLLGYAG